MNTTIIKKDNNKEINIGDTSLAHISPLIYLLKQSKNTEMVNNDIIEWDINGEKYYNNIQIFKDAYYMNNTTLFSSIGEREFNIKCKNYGIEHLKRINWTLYFGDKLTGVKHGTLKKFTDGIFSFCRENNIRTINQNFTQDTFDKNICEYIFKHNKNDKYFFVSPGLIYIIKSFINIKLENVKIFNINAYKYIYKNSILYLITDRSLYKHYNYGVVIDLEDIKYCYLKGRDTIIETNQQNKWESVDGVIEQYSTYCGLKLLHPEKHVLIKGIIE